jgi:hypothetical protein
MALRDQRAPRVSVADIVRPQDRDRAGATTTDLHPQRVAGDHDAATAIGIRVPHCQHHYIPADPQDGRPEGALWLLDPWSGSWAVLHHDPDEWSDAYRVEYFGPRNLWAEVEAAYRWWDTAGKPPADRWQFTITAHGQHIELGIAPSAVLRR